MADKGIKGKQGVSKKSLANLIPPKPGEVRNPSGRPKGSGQLTKIAISKIGEPAKGTLPPKEIKRLGLGKGATLGEAFIVSLILAAIDKPGGLSAESLLNRIDGKVPERLDVDANVGGALGNYTLDLSKLDAKEIMRILELQAKCRTEELPET